MAAGKVYRKDYFLLHLFFRIIWAPAVKTGTLPLIFIRIKECSG